MLDVDKEEVERLIVDLVEENLGGCVEDVRGLRWRGRKRRLCLRDFWYWLRMEVVVMVVLLRENNDIVLLWMCNGCGFECEGFVI